MNNHAKRACLLYRTDSTLPQDEPEMNRQRAICLAFAKQHGWYPVREFWEKVDDETGPEKTEDAIEGRIISMGPVKVSSAASEYTPPPGP